MTTATTAPPGLGPAVGRAERALSQLLGDVLAETGTAPDTWYAFQRLAAFAAPPSRQAFLRDLRGELVEDDASATALLERIVAAGLMGETREQAGDDARIRLTEAGEALRERIRVPSAALTRQLTAPFDPADVEVTIRTLAGLTERARTLRGPAAPSGRAQS
jgi:DNA-binding MarR family transcriptional regulator